MKLQFKGQSYFTINTQVKTAYTEHNACFRGQKYQIRTPVMLDNEKCQLSASIRKYRGISYIVGNRAFSDSFGDREVYGQ